MKKKLQLISAGLCLAMGMSPAWAGQNQAKRIVTVGAAISELVFALHQDQWLVGRDQTSLWPEPLTALPDIGYPRQLSLEGVLSLLPDLVLVSDDSGPKHVLDGIKASGVELMVVPTGPKWSDAKTGLAAIAKRLNAADRYAKLVAEVDDKLQQATKLQVSKQATKALFLLAEGPSGWLAAGATTRAQTLLNAAGAQNVMAAQRGYRPLGPEAILALAPDVIFMASHALKAGESLQQTLQESGLGELPAVKNARVKVVDSGRFLTLGPRFGEAVLELATWLSTQ